MIGSHNQADIVAIIGATGSGKSTRIKQLLERERPARLLVWDWKSEYPLDVVDDPRNLVDRLAATDAAAISYRPRKDRADWIARQFDVVCEAALAWGRCRFIVEELSNVTKSGWAPQPWRNVCTEGRHAALQVIGTTQRPALCDKTFVDNATLIMCGRLNSTSSKAYMADAMDVPKAEVSGLGQFQWLLKDTQTGEARRDDLTAPAPARKRPAVRR